MCMKTKDHKTQCPKKIRLLGLNFRHLRRTECHFAENYGFATTICQIHSVFLTILMLKMRRQARDEISGSFASLNP